MALIHERIAAMLADIDAIGKTKRNEQQGFMFRGIDDVYNSIHPILAKHGVFCTTEVLDSRTEERTTRAGAALIYRILTVRFTFFAADGSSVSSVLVGEGMDSGDKAGNKAMSIAHKYALIQLLAIPTADIADPDAESHEVAPKTMAAPKLAAPVAQSTAENLAPKGDAKAQALELVKKLGLDPKVRDGIMTAHGGRVETKDGLKSWVGIDWEGVLKDLLTLDAAKGGSSNDRTGG